MFDAAKGIYRQRGVQGLYAGLGVTVVEIMPYAALQFGLYDALQAAWKAHKVVGLIVCLPCARRGQPSAHSPGYLLIPSRDRVCPSR
jgi:hypothetical protein